MRYSRILKFKKYRNKVRSLNKFIDIPPLEQYELYKNSNKSFYNEFSEEIKSLKNYNTSTYLELKFKKKTFAKKLNDHYGVIDFIAENSNFPSYEKQLLLKRFEIQNKDFNNFEFINKEKDKRESKK